MPMNKQNQEFSVIGTGKAQKNCLATEAEQGDWLKHLYHPKAVKLLDQRTCSVMQAAYDAGVESGLDFMTASLRRGISLSVQAPGVEPEDFHYAFAQKNNASPAKKLVDHLNPLWVLGQLPNIPASHLAIQYNCQGPVLTCSSGDGQQGIETALDVLENDEADFMLVGACAEHSWMLIITPLEKTLELNRPTKLNFTRKTLSLLCQKIGEAW